MRVHLNSSRSYAAGRLQTAGVVNPNLLTIQLIGYGNGGSADNIVVKSDVGQFKYIGGKIHALSYTDNAATQVSTQTQKVSYTPFHRPDSLMEGDWLMTFAYGPDYERRRTDLYKLGTLTERRHYFGSGSERHENVTTGTSRDLFYIPGPDGLAAIMKREGSVVQLYFPYADHLGSVTSLTDELGNVVCRQAFDPWGRRRNPGSLLIDDNALPASYAWLRGFTGHEHLPQFRLINMNARLYDPLLGRMLSPDNYVTDVSNPMTYNLFSYANNNPVSYVDPDGNNPLIVAAIIGAAIGAYTGGSMANGNYNPTKWDYSSGKTWSYMIGGAAVGGFSAYLGAGVAASGMPFANTAGIVSASYLNSVGTAIYTGGQTGVSIGFGAASYNLTEGSLGYLGKKGNSTMENIGYGMGALANLQDAVAGFHGTVNETRAEHGDGILHSRSREAVPKGSSSTSGYDISVAHGPADIYKYDGSNGLLENLDYARAWATRIVPGEYYGSTAGGWKATLYNVNKNIMGGMYRNIKAGRSLWGWNQLKYGTTVAGCYGHVARALFSAGIPTIPFYGFTPHGLVMQLWLRQAGITASPFLINR